MSNRHRYDTHVFRLIQNFGQEVPFIVLKYTENVSSVPCIVFKVSDVTY